MHPTHRSRSYGITKTDMEASRLVFVFVKDAKPKRKVAVPVPDGYTWTEFLGQVKKKLKIVGVKEITLASSGQKITSLDELQDIDELSVVEGAESYGSSTSEAALRSGGVSTSEAAHGIDHGILPSDRHKVVIASGDVSSSPQHDDEGKYRAKVNPMRRFLQRLLPGVFAPGLPVTNRDAAGDVSGGSAAEGSRARRRRGKGRSGFSLGTAILLMLFLFCLATMVWFALKSNSVFATSSGAIDTGTAIIPEADVVDASTVMESDNGLADDGSLSEGGKVAQ